MLSASPGRYFYRCYRPYFSNRYGVINLSQGFLDFDPPREITDRLAEKTYSITGWRFSYTIAPTGISERIKKVRDQRAGQWAQGTIR